ncbi:MAG: hypothetical protein FWD44_01255 [Oscillospiraceae bacterium]|nr:hypothetical protein [Oscillospiraceae bacterium]
MKKQFGELFSLKSIITISVTSTFCYLILVGRLDIEYFMPVLTMVFTYYFTRQQKNTE